MMVGGKHKTVVIDESAFGRNKGVRKAPQKPKGMLANARTKEAKQSSAEAQGDACQCKNKGSEGKLHS